MAEATASRSDLISQSPRIRRRQRNERRKEFFDHYEWWFVVLGLIGNALFFSGSVVFLFKHLETLAISLFIAGSCFMLVSSTAASVSKYSSSK
jgi:hypothetical protein